MKKGDEAWVFRITYGRFHVGSHRITALGQHLAGLSGSGAETRYSSRVPVDAIYPSRRAALEAALKAADAGCDGARERLAEAEALRAQVASALREEEP